MAVDRMIRAEMRRSKKVNSWPIPLRYFWTQLWGYCDDFGRGIYDAQLIVADTFPRDDSVTAETVDRWMKGLESAGVIRAYRVAGEDYFEVVNWDEHQELRYRKKSKLPEPSAELRAISQDSETLRARTLQGEGEVEVEEKGEGASARPSRYCSEHPSGTKEKCARCKDARIEQEAWDRAETSKPTPAPRREVVSPDECKHWKAKRIGSTYCDRCDSMISDSEAVAS